MNIGHNLKKIRKSKRLTQEKLSEITQISIASIQRYESGKRQPNIQTINKIAEALGVPVSEILGSNATTNNIGTKIVSAQTINNISHEELAERTGIDEKYLRIIKSNQVNPTNEELNKIASVLDYPLSYFTENLSENINNEIIKDKYNPVELQIEFGIYKEEMTREQLYALIYYYQNKVAILEKKELATTKKLETLIDFIKYN